MRWRVAGFGLAIAAAGLLGCGGAGAAGTRWQVLVDKTYGISVAVPRTWCIVPPSVGQIQSLMTALEKHHYPALADIYFEFISTADARAEMSRYLFQAFQCASPYPSAYPDLTDFTIAVARTARTYSAIDLTADAASIAKVFATQGMTATRSMLVTLPAGAAALITATWKEQTGITAHVEEYVIPHGKLLFNLSFRADIRLPTAPTTFAAIARRFDFT